jgi:hypothetical protein
MCLHGNTHYFYIADNASTQKYTKETIGFHGTAL